MENLSEHLKENVTYINGLFENAMDYIEREFMVGTVPAALLTMDGLVSKQHITLSILNPLMRAKIPTDNGKETLLFIEENVLCAVEQAELSTVSEVLERMMNGFAVLLLDNCPTALAFGTQGFAARGVDEPDTEVMQRGSREGFVETYQTNISLLRRRLKTTELKFEKVTVGEESQTPAALCYLKNIADPKIINTLKKRLSACNLKDVLAAGYLAGYLERPAIFDRVGFTERPDTLCGKLHEGRIGLLIDGTPTALYVPYLFVENFQTADDYANRPFYATFTRWLKYIAFFLAIFLPGLYVGIAAHDPELLPETLLVTIAQAERSTPFPVMLEAILLYFMYEHARSRTARTETARQLCRHRGRSCHRRDRRFRRARQRTVARRHRRHGHYRVHGSEIIRAHGCTASYFYFGGRYMGCVGRACRLYVFIIRALRQNKFFRAVFGPGRTISAFRHAGCACTRGMETISAS